MNRRLEGAPMETLTYSLNGWSTEQLVGEVVRRSAADGQALRSVEGAIIRARLAESDSRFAGSSAPAGTGPATETAGVRGTPEMGLANDGGKWVLPGVAHDVDAATSGAHTHDHTHRKRSSWKLAAHDH